MAGVTGPGRILFATLKASGAHGGGAAELSAHWAREAPEMAASGIPLVGGCHRLSPGNALTQVDAFLEAMELIGGYQGRLVQLDCEAADPATLLGWLAEWRTRTDGYPVLGYLPDWAEAKWPFSDLSSWDFAGWWASEYVEGTGTPLELLAKVTEDKWHLVDGLAPTILQFTSKSVVPGVPGTCDANVFRGTLNELKVLATK